MPSIRRRPLKAIHFRQPLFRLCAVMAFLSTLAMLDLGGIDSMGYQALAGEPRSGKAPAFSVWDVDGNRRALSDFLNVKPILLEFMSPTCPHCVEMAPLLGRVHTIYGERVQFLTVAFDRDVQRIKQFVGLEKHPWPYLVGNQQVIDGYRLEGVPAFCFVAPDGRMVKFMVGSMPEKTLRENIDALLKAQ